MTKPSLSDATKIWAKIGFLSFGGPAAQIALMHKEVVTENKWLSEQQYLNALNFCMLLPGPEAMQLATYSGWRLHGTIGGLIAGLCFVLPGAFVMGLLAYFYVLWGNTPLVDAVFLGVKATVVIIVFSALLRLSKKALGSGLNWLIATGAFLSIYVFQIPFPAIILLAAVIGIIWGAAPKATPIEIPNQNSASTFKVIISWLIIWAMPFALIAIFDASFLQALGLFFSKLAIVTFGGAYAVLAYMAQEVVGLHGWLNTAEMLDGLGLAETTPGPLILVTEFVGFVAGWKEGGLTLAIVAAFLTLWVTFAPCFLWIFAGAPYLDWLTGLPRLQTALHAITAAVVGVIFNLSLFFAVSVFFDQTIAQDIVVGEILWPIWSSLNWIVVLHAALAAWLLLSRGVGVFTTLLICSTSALVLGVLT